MSIWIVWVRDTKDGFEFILGLHTEKDDARRQVDAYNSSPHVGEMVAYIKEEDE